MGDYQIVPQSFSHQNQPAMEDFLKDHFSSALGVGSHNRLHCTYKLVAVTQQTQNICITFVQCLTNVEDVGPFDAGPTLYKCLAMV